MNDSSMTATPRQGDIATTRLNDLTVVPAYEPILREAGLDSVEALFACRGEASLAKPGLDSWRTRLRIEVRTPDGPLMMYVKRYDQPPARARREAARSGCGAASVAGVEWNWIRQLTAAGIPCVDAVALGESFADGREMRSVLMTAEVPGEALERVVPTWAGESRQRVRRLIPALADLVARLHDAGFVHRDLYLSHVFFDADAAPEDALKLIDLQRVRRPTWNAARWIVKDLAALNYSTPKEAASNADRVRWLKCYLGQKRLDKVARQLVYRVVGKTRQIARHDARRNSRLHRRHPTP